MSGPSPELHGNSGGPRLLTSSHGATSSSSAALSGVLEATILSVYDLPYAEPPSSVTLSACGMVVQTGPPVARHKDRNSFRFSTNTGSPVSDTNSTKGPHEVQLIAPLRTLYPSTLTIRVVYANQPAKMLEASYEIQQLKIHETKWLILNLSGGDTVTTVSGDEEDTPPTIRLKMHLSGPYRPEVAALLNVGKSWCGLVDSMEGNITNAVSKIPKIPLPADPKVLILPAVPIVAAVAVVSPLLAEVSMVVLPVVLPVVLAIIGVALAVLLSGGVLYVSTGAGRAWCGSTLGPLLEHFVTSRAGQTLVYDTGPRPTPVHVAKQIVPTHIWSKLFFSLLLDIIGSSSYLLPVVGEGFDLAWAPLQTIFIMAMYEPTSPNLKYVSFVEEVLPFTDIVPTATIGWACEFVPQLVGREKMAVVEELVMTKQKQLFAVPESTAPRATAGIPVH